MENNTEIGLFKACVYVIGAFIGLALCIAFPPIALIALFLIPSDAW